MKAVNFEQINQLKNENFESQKFQQENFKMTEGGTLTMIARYVRIWKSLENFFENFDHMIDRLLSRGDLEFLMNFSFLSKTGLFPYPSLSRSKNKVID